jgi:hypothetical protein
MLPGMDRLLLLSSLWNLWLGQPLQLTSTGGFLGEEENN